MSRRLRRAREELAKTIDDLLELAAIQVLLGRADQAQESIRDARRSVWVLGGREGEPQLVKDDPGFRAGTADLPGECEECGEATNPLTLPDGRDGVGCDSCGWSWP